MPSYANFSPSPSVSRSGNPTLREQKSTLFSVLGTRNRNRTCNYPLGGGYYIHLTMQASGRGTPVFYYVFADCAAVFFAFLSLMSQGR